MSNLVIAGITGLIGSEILQLDLSTFEKVYCLARKDVTLPKDNCYFIKTNFENIELPKAESTDDAVICALGTTIKKAGSKDAFKKVDYQMVLSLAESAFSSGYKRFLLVSSLGADAKSTNFYLKTKGELEKSLMLIGFEHLCFVRPSLLLGVRQELRLGEKIGTLLAPLLNPILSGKLRRYRPVEASSVAKQLILQATEQQESILIIESENI